VSATIGVMTLHFGGIVPRGQVAEAWRAWWLGDAIGALLVAPPLLVWTARPVFASTRRLLEAILLAASVIVTSLLIFSAPNVTTPAFNQAYLIFPLMIWAAVRFGQHGAVSTSLVVSVIAVWATATGHGPFLHNTLHGSLFALQIFAGVTASTFLVLGAATAERERAVRELRIAHGIAATANQAKAEFLAVMSHELRTPLNAIASRAIQNSRFAPTQQSFVRFSRISPATRSSSRPPVGAFTSQQSPAAMTCSLALPTPGSAFRRTS